MTCDDGICGACDQPLAAEDLLAEAVELLRDYGTQAFVVQQFLARMDAIEDDDED